MGDLILLYTAFSFFIMLGVSIDNWGKHSESRLGLVILVVLSPVMLPVYIGMWLSNNDLNNKLNK